MDKAQAMCLHACLPDSYWEFMILHAAHVYSMTSMNRLNWRTPLELLKEEKPSVSHLRVFGCSAYVHLPDETRKGKLQPKSQLMVYLGVSAGSEHNYLFMRPNNALHTSTHAIFDEHLFPKCSGARPHKPVSHAPRNPHKDTPNGHKVTRKSSTMTRSYQTPLVNNHPWYNRQCEPLRRHHPRHRLLFHPLRLPLLALTPLLLDHLLSDMVNGNTMLLSVQETYMENAANPPNKSRKSSANPPGSDSLAKNCRKHQTLLMSPVAYPHLRLRLKTMSTGSPGKGEMH
jgi:hypothetical protein